MYFLSLLCCSLRTENRVTFWTVLELVNDTNWLSFEYKSCSLFSLDVFRIFICCHCYCGIKLIKMRSNIPTAVWLMLTVLPVTGLGHRNILLVVCFMCMIILVLKITYGQVVLLWAVLNLVAWQLETANKCSAMVYKISLVIWITSI
jgi:hypothetical protein